MPASLPKAVSPGPLPAGSRHSSCWSSYANAVQCTRARSMTISRTARSRTTGAARRAPRAARCLGRRDRPHLRAAAQCKPEVLCAAAALRHAAVARRAEERLAASQRAALACARRWHRLVLAGRGGCGAPCAAGEGALADALRPGGAGPRPLRAFVGLGLPFRSLHAGAQTQARLLRSAAALARPRDRLGQPLREGRRSEIRARIRRIAAARSRLPARARGGAGSYASLSRPRILNVHSARPRLRTLPPAVPKV